MTSEDALAFARAHDAVGRALNLTDETRWAAHDAFLGFQRLGAPHHVTMNLLVEARLQVDIAQLRLEDRMQRAKDVESALFNIGVARRLFDAIHRTALDSYRIDIPDPTLPPAEVFRGAEAMREFLQDWPDLEAAARAMYGFAAERIRDVGAARRGAVGRFAYRMRALIPDRESHDRFAADLIGPALGDYFLAPKDVRKYFDAYDRRQSAP